MTDVVEAHLVRRLYKTELHLLDYLSENVNRFKALILPGGSEIECRNVRVKDS